MNRLAYLLREELEGIHPRYLAACILLAPLPPYMGERLRGVVLKMMGFKIGYGSAFAGMPAISGSRPLQANLRIGAHCWFNIGCIFDVGGAIQIGDHVSAGHQVIFMTTSHEIGRESRRAGALTLAPITIGDGAWLGSRSMVLPGVTIGLGAVVAAGAVVTHSVPPNTIVAGIPAKVIRELEPFEARGQAGTRADTQAGTARLHPMHGQDTYANTEHHYSNV